ncbi:MAG TPA: hypothetical protein VFE98_04260 [Candidatus Bathyarchaeia archaeon]|nr:hypothetical protein [Candidatus Bathyarchaeia archaeon]
MSTTSTSQIVILPGAVLLLLAWVTSAVIIVAGMETKKAWLVSTGVSAAGVMTIVSPLVYYLSETIRLGTFQASIQDFLIIASLSTLGGGIITYALLRVGRRRLST